MKKLLYLTLLSGSILVLAACSKEKKFQKNLYKHDGEWKITTMNYTLIKEIDYQSPDTLYGTAALPGVFRFDKDGGGEYSFIVEGGDHTRPLYWKTVDETTLSVTWAADKYDFWTGDEEFVTTVFTGEKTDKNEMTLSGTEYVEADVYSSGQNIKNTLTATFYLEKK